MSLPAENLPADKPPAGNLHADAVRTLSGWAAPDDATQHLRTAYLAHLRVHDDALLRTCLPTHLTASAMVLDQAGERVLLSLHAKGGFWVQPGGHCEPGDATLAGAALREAVEECGIAGLRLLSEAPVDLDRHALSSAFGRCGEHLDVRYAVVAPPGAEPVISDESDDVAWFAVDALPPSAVDDLDRLVRRARAAFSTGRAAQVSSSSDRPRSAVADTPSR